METFWFFRLRFRRAYDTAYDSDFRFSQVISCLMTPTTTPTPTPSLVKTSLKECFICAWQIAIYVLRKIKNLIPGLASLSHWSHGKQHIVRHRSLIGICYLFHSERQYTREVVHVCLLACTRAIYSHLHLLSYTQAKVFLLLVLRV